MKIKIIFFTLITTVTFYSCSRQYYFKYFSKRLRETTLKYDPKATINIRYTESKDTVKLTKRKIDELIAMLEKGYALIPDSMSIRITGNIQEGGAFKSTQQVRDSFYFRKQKIEFIKKHDLVTPTKHFIPRERWNEMQ